MIKLAIKRNKFQHFFYISTLIIILYISLIYIFEKKWPTSIIRVEKFDEIDATKSYEIVRLGDLGKSSFVTIVTSFFRFEKAKHSQDNYTIWSRTMLNSLNSPLVAFVDHKSAPMFIQTCQKRNLSVTIYITSSIWNIMRDLEIERNRSYIDNYVNMQARLDPERFRHSPELYAVWNLKLFLVNKTAHVNPYKSEFFMYTDSGAWRGRRFRHWPNEEFVSEFARKLNDRILLVQVGNLSISGENLKSADLIQGGFFAGSARAIHSMCDDFYRLHDIWMNFGLFIGKDQTIMNRLTFRLVSSKVLRLRTFDLECREPYDKWFFFQYYFANQDEYICKEDKYSLLIYM